MSTAESCSAKLNTGKKLITAEMRLHGWFYTTPVFTALISWIHLTTIAFENSFQDLNKEI